MKRISPIYNTAKQRKIIPNKSNLTWMKRGDILREVLKMPQTWRQKRWRGKHILKAKSWGPELEEEATWRGGMEVERVVRPSSNTCRGWSWHGGHRWKKWAGHGWVSPLLNKTAPRYPTDSHNLSPAPTWPNNSKNLDIHRGWQWRGDDKDLGAWWYGWRQGGVLDRLGNDRWMVDGSGGWGGEKADHQKREKYQKMGEEIKWSVICKANVDNVGGQRKRKTGAFQWANNQENWSRNRWDMKGTKKWK